MVDREERRKLKELSYFDQFADASDSDDPDPPRQGNFTYPDIDHFEYLTPPRHQGSCGSCWAFSTATTVEANYNILRKRKLVNETGWISTQSIMDCNPDKYGCDGGWMNKAMRSLMSGKAVWESDYPYTTVQGTECKNTTKIQDLRIVPDNPISGCAWSSWFEGFKNCTKDSFYNTLKKGPVSVVMKPDINFKSYRSGVIDATQIPTCQTYGHAVVAYSWKNVYDADNNVKHVISIRNSWGAGFGDNGNARYYYDDQGTCYITRLALLPNLY
jgi:C1A family cysteine protease